MNIDNNINNNQKNNENENENENEDFYEFADIHRAFLQLMLSHRVLDMEIAEGFYDTFCAIDAEHGMFYK